MLMQERDASARLKGSTRTPMQPTVPLPGNMVVPPRRRDLRENELEGEVLLVDSVTGKTHHLNRTALAVWQRCDGHETTRGLAKCQMKTFDVPFEKALDDVEQLVSLFAASDLLILGGRP